MIKIITGWSNPGGSTTAFINLTKLFNKHNIDCKLFGTHSWHLDKCKSDTINNLSLDENDNLIVHFFDPHWDTKPPINGKLIYSCHEKDVRPINTFNYKIYDKIHYVSRPQKEWHNVDHPSFIVPNVIEELKQNSKFGYAIAGIIGSIDRNKQTHISIKRALDDGMKIIFLYGNVTDEQYFDEEVNPLLDKHPCIKMMNYETDKQKMYDSISDVYLSSLSETWSYLPKECEMTGTTFHGTDAIKDNFEIEMTNEEILEYWKKEFGLNG